MSLSGELRAGRNSLRRKAISFLTKCGEANIEPSEDAVLDPPVFVDKFCLDSDGHPMYVFSRRIDRTDRGQKYVEANDLRSLIDLVETAELYINSQNVSDL